MFELHFVNAGIEVIELLPVRNEAFVGESPDDRMQSQTHFLGQPLKIVRHFAPAILQKHAHGTPSALMQHHT
jgi:hypothetical protein